MQLTEKQRLYGQWVLFGVVLIVIVWTLIIITEPEQPSDFVFDEDSEEKEISISQLTDGAKENDLWRERSAREMEEMHEELKDLQDGSTIKRSEFLDLTQKFEQLIRDKDRDDTDAKEVIDQQAGIIQSLQDDITLLKTQKPAPQAAPLPATTRPVANSDPFRRASGSANKNGNGNQPYEPVNPIEKVVFQLDEPEGLIQTFNSDTYIPAGSYVTASVIEGVSASVGINAGVDPRPIEFRVTGKAISAIGPEGAETFDLKGCLAQGAARGDLSSERVYVQLLKLTCSHEAGTVFEVPVKGHISSNGQAGIRGNVVQRNGEFLEKTFFAGIFAGGGQGLNALSTPTATFGGSGFATQQRPDLGDVTGIALGEGFSQTGERLSDYYIKQAEQYQPVVEVTPGITVEIVFTEGVRLDVK